MKTYKRRFRESGMRVNHNPNGLYGKKGIDFDISFIEMLLKRKSFYTQKEITRRDDLVKKLKELKTIKRNGDENETY